MPDIDVIAGYVVDQPLPTPTEVGGSRYEYDDFTESQPVEGEEYVPNTEYTLNQSHNRYKFDKDRVRQ